MGPNSTEGMQREVKDGQGWQSLICVLRTVDVIGRVKIQGLLKLIKSPN